MDLMLMLGLNEAFGKLAMACSVCWYGHVLRREVEGEKRKEKPEMTLKKNAHKAGVTNLRRIARLQVAHCTITSGALSPRDNARKNMPARKKNN